MSSGGSAVRVDRVVAVVATLRDGREQIGSGYLTAGRLVLTAEHCTRNKVTGESATQLRVVRATDGAVAEVNGVVSDQHLDVAVLRVADDAPWDASLPSLAFARVDQSQAGVLYDCTGIGFPLFQRDTGRRTRHTSEFHGKVYQTDERESGRLLMREPLIHPGPVIDSSADSPWGGLSGALVFYCGNAIGVVTEHHPRQGDSALRMMAFDTLARKAATDPAPGARGVAEALGLPNEDQLPWAGTIPIAEAAAAALEEARVLSRDGELEAAARLNENAVTLADESDNNELRIQAHLRASHIYGRQAGLLSVEGDARRRLLDKMARHVDAAVALGADPMASASERLVIARLGTSPKEVLHWADEITRIAAPDDTSSQVDVVCARLEALIDADRPGDAFALSDEVERLRPLADTEGRLILASTWLLLLMTYRADNSIQQEVGSFVADVRQSVEQGQITRNGGEIFLRTVAEQARERGRFDDALMVMREAYGIARSHEELALSMAMLALRAAELAAVEGNTQLTQRYLGEVALWWPRAIPASPGTADREVGIRVQVQSSRGRILALLADRLGEDRKAREDALHEAYKACVLARKLADENRAALAGETDTDVFIADLAWWLGCITQDLGRSDEAVDWFRCVRTDAAMADANFAFERGRRAWLREAESLRLAGRTREARDVVGHLLDDTTDDERPEEVSSQARAFQIYLDNREMPIINLLDSPEAAAIRQSAHDESLRVVVARAVAELVSSWERWRGEDYRSLLQRFDTAGSTDITFQSDLQSVLMDVWGRGGFLNVATAIRANPLSAIAVDARSVSEIASWARILCPVYDTVIIKWKGSLGGEFTLAPMPGDGGFAGGSGFTWVDTPRSLLDEGFAAAMGWSNPVPAQVSRFLSGPALDLVRAGRLVVLPAALVGCTQFPVGWTDDLLVSGLLGGVLNVGRAERGSSETSVSAQPMVDLSIIKVPFIDGISMSDLAAVLDEATEWAGPLKRAFLKPLTEKNSPLQELARRTIIDSEINDACRFLEGKLEVIASKEKTGSWRIEHASGTMSARSRPSASPGEEPVTEVLRSVGPLPPDVAPWVSFWLLKRRGGRLDWTAPLTNSARQPEPGANSEEELYSWLWPQTEGRMHTVIVRTPK